MRCLSYVLVLVLLVSTVSAGIDMTTQLDDVFNLGVPIMSSFEVVSSEDVDALFRLEIDCEGYNLDYFIVLLSLSAETPLVVNPPCLKPVLKMKGECRLNSYLESLEKKVIESYSSDYFIVSDEITVSLNIDNIDVFPGDDLVVEGEISKDKAEVFVAFDGKQDFLAAVDGKFSKEIKIADDIKSGEHMLFVDANDDFGNIGDTSLILNVIPVVSRIDYMLNNDTLKPEDTMSMTVNLYDQAEDIVLGRNVLVEIEDIFSSEVNSGEEISFDILSSTKPGNYGLIIIYGDIQVEDEISIEEVKLLDVKLEGEKVRIKNIGNVNYNDLAELNLYGAEKNYFLSKKINLAVGEEMYVDLSKEVSTDNYEVDVIIDDEQLNIGKNVAIEDKRSLLGKITGSLVSVGDGILSKNPVLASIILVLVILGISLFFVLRRKKEKEYQ